MELSLSDGWTQVEPRETQFELLMSDQSMGQRLITTNTAFTEQRDLGFSGGTNCPLAVDRALDRVYVSVDGIVGYGIHEAQQLEFKFADDLHAVWMLEHLASGQELLMHLAGGDPRQSFIGRLDLENGHLRKVSLPAEAFFPLDLNAQQNKVLYSTPGGATIYDLRGPLHAIAAVDLPFHATGGAFDADDVRVILGGIGLVDWRPESGELRRLCERGSCPAIDKDGSVWFSVSDGALARLRGDETGYEVIVELAEFDISDGKDGSFAQPLVFSPDGRYGLAELTGRRELVGTELEEAEAFCKRVGQPFSDLHRYKHHHYFCVLDFLAQDAWCCEGYAQNTAWIAGA